MISYFVTGIFIHNGCWYYTEGKKVKQPVIMGFPIGDLSSIRFFLLAGAKTCQLFKCDLMATCKRSKETNSDFIVRI